MYRCFEIKMLILRGDNVKKPFLISAWVYCLIYIEGKKKKKGDQNFHNEGIYKIGWLFGDTTMNES